MKRDLKANKGKGKKDKVKKDDKEDDKKNKNKKDKKLSSKKNLKRLRNKQRKLKKLFKKIKFISGKANKRAFRMYRRFLIRKRISKLKELRRTVKLNLRRRRMLLKKSLAMSVYLAEGSRSQKFYLKKSLKLKRQLKQSRRRLRKLNTRISVLMIKHSQLENTVLLLRVRVFR